jgi:hypothetical protein
MGILVFRMVFVCVQIRYIIGNQIIEAVSYYLHASIEIINL